MVPPADHRYIPGNSFDILFQPTSTRSASLSRHQIVTLSMIAALGTACAILAGCSSDRMAARCSSEVTGATSPATGVLTLTGHFYQNESIIVRDERTSTQVASGTPASDRTSFTFTNIPSGIHTFEIIASCSDGQQDVGAETVTIL